MHGEYPEYHTSGDDLEFIRPAQLAGALETVLDIVNVLEGNGRFVNQNPKCEPQLGRRGLYRVVGGAFDSKSTEMAMLWVLNHSDGEHDLLDIASVPDLPFDAVKRAADLLVDHDLLAPVPAPRRSQREDPAVDAPRRAGRGVGTVSRPSRLLRPHDVGGHAGGRGARITGSSRRASRDRRKACCVASTAAPR